MNYGPWFVALLFERYTLYTQGVPPVINYG